MRIFDARASGSERAPVALLLTAMPHTGARVTFACALWRNVESRPPHEHAQICATHLAPNAQHTPSDGLVAAAALQRCAWLWLEMARIGEICDAVLDEAKGVCACATLDPRLVVARRGRRSWNVVSASSGSSSRGLLANNPCDAPKPRCHVGNCVCGRLATAGLRRRSEGLGTRALSEMRAT